MRLAGRTLPAKIPPVTMPAPIRVALVEDDDAFRELVRGFLDRTPGLACVGALADFATALAALPSLVPDVVLVDIQLPGRSGIDCVLALRPRLPRAQWVMLTTFDDDDLVFRSLQAGAAGYLLKRSAPGEIVDAIRDVHHGGSPMTSHIARKVVQAFHRPPALPGSHEGLSAREQELLRHLAHGLAYKEVADRMAISIDTVRSHIRRVYEKLEVHSRTEAVVKYLGR
jgi:DNA-binding NarL/FixJ family response regulator